MEDSGNTVFPTNRFPLVIVSAAVGNRHLNDFTLPFSEFRRNLRFKTEPIRIERNLLENRCPNHLIAGLHIGEFRAVDNVCGGL